MLGQGSSAQRWDYKRFQAGQLCIFLGGPRSRASAGSSAWRLEVFTAFGSPCSVGGTGDKDGTLWAVTSKQNLGGGTSNMITNCCYLVCRPDTYRSTQKLPSDSLGVSIPSQTVHHAASRFRTVVEITSLDRCDSGRLGAEVFLLMGRQASLSPWFTSSNGWPVSCEAGRAWKIWGWARKFGCIFCIGSNRHGFSVQLSNKEVFTYLDLEYLSELGSITNSLQLFSKSLFG